MATKRAILAIPDAEDRRSLGYARMDLERWLRDLLSLAEVVASEEMIAWLSDDHDEPEDDDNRNNNDAYNKFLSTRVDFALANAPVRRMIVKHGKSESIQLSVPSGYFVVWSFCSKPRDIAFTLIFTATSKAAREYERVPSHQRLCQGIWQNTIAEACEVTASWGNEYAKWRDKRIFFQLDVISPSAMDAARDRHTRHAEREAEREAHRQALERVARKLAARVGLFFTIENAERPSSRAIYSSLVDDDLISIRDDEKDNEIFGENDDDTESIRSTSQSGWSLMPPNELRAALHKESQRVASLENALFLAEKEATSCRLARDEASTRLSESEKVQRTLSGHLNSYRSKLEAEIETRSTLEEELTSLRKKVQEIQQHYEFASTKAETLEKRAKALERERDLLAQAVQSYRDSAELARGDARSARDELQHTRDQLLALNNNHTNVNHYLNGGRGQTFIGKPQQRPLLSAKLESIGDEQSIIADTDFELADDDLLLRVDALQSRIDSELSSVQRAALGNISTTTAKSTSPKREKPQPILDEPQNNFDAKRTFSSTPPNADDTVQSAVDENHTEVPLQTDSATANDENIIPDTQSPSTQRRHDLVVPDGFNPGDILPFVAEGLNLSVPIPDGLLPGDVFTIELR